VKTAASYPGDTWRTDRHRKMLRKSHERYFSHSWSTKPFTF